MKVIDNASTFINYECFVKHEADFYSYVCSHDNYTEKDVKQKEYYQGQVNMMTKMKREALNKYLAEHPIMIVEQEDL